MTAQVSAVTTELPHGRMLGNCKWFNDLKGYGFIGGNDGREYFVHQSSIMSKGYRVLEVNQKVEFEVIIDNDRLKAVNVSAPGGLHVKCERRKPHKPSLKNKKRTSCMYGSYTKFSNSQHSTENASFARDHFSGGCSTNRKKTLGYRRHSNTAVQWEQQVKRGICYSWRRGECHRGEICRFDHPQELKHSQLFDTSKPLCYQWQEGTCNKGENCQLIHFPTE